MLSESKRYLESKFGSLVLVLVVSFVGLFTTACGKKTGTVTGTISPPSDVSVAMKPCVQSGRVNVEGSAKVLPGRSVCRFQPVSSDNNQIAMLALEEEVKPQTKLRTVRGRSVALDVHLGFEDQSEQVSSRLSRADGEKLVAGVRTVCGDRIRRVFARSGIGLQLKLTWMDPNAVADKSISAVVPIQATSKDSYSIKGELYSELTSSFVPSPGFCYQVLGRTFETIGRISERSCSSLQAEIEAKKSHGLAGAVTSSAGQGEPKAQTAEEGNPQTAEKGAVRKGHLASLKFEEVGEEVRVKVNEEAIQAYRTEAEQMLSSGSLSKPDLVEILEPVCPGFGRRLGIEPQKSESAKGV